MPQLVLVFDSGETSLSVHHFSVEESMSAPFRVSIRAGSPRPDLDLDSIVGRPAELRLEHELAPASGEKRPWVRRWTGICSFIERVKAVVAGDDVAAESTYELTIVPRLWLLSQRRNYRIFQHLSVPDIACAILAEWGIEPLLWIDRTRYPKLDFRLQYGETDLAFLSRQLEEAGIAYFFDNDPEKGAVLALSDQPHAAPSRGRLLYDQAPTLSQSAERELVTELRVSREVRPGAFTLCDHDFRKPSFPLVGRSRQVEAAAMGSPGPSPGMLEQYHYVPGTFLIETSEPSDTPAADDKSVARAQQQFGRDWAARLLQAEEVRRRRITFHTNVTTLCPGVVFSVEGHAGGDLDDRDLLLLESSTEGTPSAWTVKCVAVFAIRYAPLCATPRPRITGVQSATVVGPPGEEVYTDEFGRVRVQFPWDREGKNDDNSSCWMRVNYATAGVGYGSVVLPHIGQEVLVSFVDGNPDLPLVVGRVYNATCPVPYKLPENKLTCAWKSIPRTPPVLAPGATPPPAGGVWATVGAHVMATPAAAPPPVGTPPGGAAPPAGAPPGGAAPPAGTPPGMVVAAETAEAPETTKAAPDRAPIQSFWPPPVTSNEMGSENNDGSQELFLRAVDLMSVHVNNHMVVYVGDSRREQVGMSRSSECKYSSDRVDFNRTTLIGAYDWNSVGEGYRLILQPKTHMPTTWITMVDGMITLTTDKLATQIVLDKDDITIEAKGKITLKAGGDVEIKGKVVYLN